MKYLNMNSCVKKLPLMLLFLAPNLLAREERYEVIFAQDEYDRFIDQLIKAIGEGGVGTGGGGGSSGGGGEAGATPSAGSSDPGAGTVGGEDGNAANDNQGDGVGEGW